MPKAYISINWVQLSLSWGHREQPDVALSAIAAALLAAFSLSVCSLPTPIFEVVLLCRAVVCQAHYLGQSFGFKSLDCWSREDAV